MQNTTDTLVMPWDLATQTAPGRYTLVREAGRGGMSVVHEARDAATGQTVAVKVLAAPPGLTPQQAHDMRARFEREARAVAGLRHPNIVHTHELTEQDGQTFLVMEFLRGETLRQRLGRGPLAPAQALPVLRQVADALDAIHAEGLVHRDVKPSNVMLLPDGTAKLLDFGLARHGDDAVITGTGALVGSPAYMDPEQARGGPVTPASDVWALGALLYEALAGHPPFTGDSVASVLYQVTHEDPAPVAGLTRPVRRVLRRSLAKNPARRYPSARALAEALAAATSVGHTQSSIHHRAALALAAFLLLGLTFSALRQRVSPATSPFVPPAALVAPLSPTLDADTKAVPVPKRVWNPKEHSAVRRRHERHQPPHHKPKPSRPARLPAARPMKSMMLSRRPAPAYYPKRPRPMALPHRKAFVATVARRPPRYVPHVTAARHVAGTLPVRHIGLRSMAVRLTPLPETPDRMTPVPETRVKASALPRKRDSSDAEESLRLQKFIWSVGR